MISNSQKRYRGHRDSKEPGRFKNERSKGKDLSFVFLQLVSRAEHSYVKSLGDKLLLGQSVGENEKTTGEYLIGGHSLLTNKSIW